TTFGTVSGNSAAGGGDGIDVRGGGTGDVKIHTFAAVSGDPAIIINMGGNIDIITATTSPTTGATTAIRAITTGSASHTPGDVSADVTGQAGFGITTTTVGGLNTINVKPNVTVTGTGATFAAVDANTNTGTINVNIDATAVATNTTGIGVRLNTNAAGPGTPT